MKTTSLLIALVLVTGAASAVKAADEKDTKQERQQDKKVQSEKAKRAPDEGTPLTGSLIKRNVRRAGEITYGSSQVLVLDRDAIERSGASDLKQVLIRRGIH
jgi:outer membrane cobalamin receptor